MDNDKVLQFVKQNGPLLPAQLAKELNQNIIIAGALLSGLADAGKIKISNTKIGGSPVYYTEEQRHKLQDLYKYLNEKDKRAYDLIKQKGVLRDNVLTPLLRVSLRNIKDFARPVEVGTSKGKEIFWRWYMVPMSQAEPKIKEYFQPAQKEAEPKTQNPKPEEPQAPKEEPKETDDATESQDPPKTEDTKPEGPQAPKEKPKETDDATEFQDPDGDPLYEKTKKYFNKQDIKILDTEIIRKNSEIDYIIEVPSQVGKIKYYCKAKVKKKNNEGDIAQAFVKGQMKKLPVLYLTNGDLTKKAKDAIDTEYENLKYKKLG